MILRYFKSIFHHARYFPLWSALTVFRWRAFDLRSRALGTTFGFVIRWFPIARRRFDREAKKAFPKMKRRTRNNLGREMGRNMGRTLFEIYHLAEFHTLTQKFKISGSGLVGDFPSPAECLIKYSYFSQKLAGHINVL